MKSFLKGLRSWWGTPIVGVCGAMAATWMHWPLPWIIGSMLAVIAVRCIGWRIGEIPKGRISGQCMIATSIGLHFTPLVLDEIIQRFPMMLLVAFLTLGIALVGISFMHRRGMDLTTAYFAFMPANFAEMIQLGMRHKADVGKIAAAHSVRLALIVLCVPPTMFYLAHVLPNATYARLPADWHWLAPMLLGGALVAMGWKRLGWPNPWMFGPMALCAFCTAMFNLQMALPVELSHYGQLMIGCALGTHFDRQFFRSAPTYLLKVAAFTLSMIGFTVLTAWLLSHVIDLPTSTLALGMMPGSSTEMYLTAEALHLAVGLVTAMQIMRLVVVLLCAEPIHDRWVKRCALPEREKVD